MQEALDDILPVGGVLDLGVRLHAHEAALGVLEGGNGSVFGRGEHGEALGRCRDRVAVAHPDGLRLWLAREQRAVVADLHGRRSVFAAPRAGHGAAEGSGHDLESVADA